MLASLRDDFPILSVEVNGRPLIYLDNAATTQKPRKVIEAEREFYERLNANVHRGIHYLSREASELYERAHETLARFINAEADEIVFTSNTTDAINMVAWGWAVWNLREGDRIVTTEMEHHSNMLPWRLVAELRGCEVAYVTVDGEGVPRMDEAERLIDERTRLVAISGMSNVTGFIPDVERFVRLAREVGALVLVDGAQMVPHMPVDVRRMDIDFLAFSGHKMLGPTGTGVLYGRREVLAEMRPARPGGGTIEDVTLEGQEWAGLPWRHEGGTPNIAGAVGLAAAADYLMRVGMERVREHELVLTRRAIELLSDLDGLILYGPGDPLRRGGIVAFNVRGMDPHMVGALLDARGIAVRTGLHCAHPLHRRLGAPQGTVRASFYLYNTEEEIETLAEELREIVNLS
ncbi:MAG: cysteine desulfurase [Candidatus Korarchaeota archaeon NZ13-K]|nr:MAG: cysteine desulfurase [Candidatus Korarchaeota archaeon NZ13-K]